MSLSESQPYESKDYKVTAPPNESWTWGQGVDATAQGREWMAGEKQGWKHIDTAAEDPMKLYHFMLSGIIPRPIAFVSTVSEGGVENLAPFSWFNMVTAFPAIISISCGNGPERIKDTARNMKSGNGFTVNIISVPWAEQSNSCAITSPEEVSEWGLSGLTKEPSLSVKAARVKESAFSMECELFKAIDIVHPVTKVATTTLVLALVKHIHVRNDMLTERGMVDPAKLKPLARLGDISYSTLGDGFRLPRFIWKDESENIDEALKGCADSV